MKKVLCGSGILYGISVGLFLCLACAPSAVAQPQPSVIPGVTLSAEGVGSWNCYMYPSDFQLLPGGKMWGLTSPVINTWGGTTMTVQELRYDPDPLIYNNILVHNNTGVNQIYTLGVTLSTTFGAPSLIRGSIDTSLIGLNAAVSNVAPFSVYSAQIDGVTVRTLQDDPFFLTTPNNAVSSSASYGYELNGVAVTSNIGILLRFELTPGDTATIISDFELVAVPEPSSFALVGLGLIGILARVRRKAA